MAGNSSRLSVISTLLSPTWIPWPIRVSMPCTGAGERAGNPGDAVMGFGRGAIQADLDQARRELAEQRRDFIGHQRAIGEQRDQETVALGKGIDLAEILTQQRLASGQQQIEASRILDVGDDLQPLPGAQFGAGGIRLLFPGIAVACSPGCSGGSAPGFRRWGCAGFRFLRKTLSSTGRRPARSPARRCGLMPPLRSGRFPVAGR